MILPADALAVLQPWAWAIIRGGKDIENRTAIAISKGNMRPGRVAIHASKGMTRAYYEHARDCMAELGVRCPPPHELERGGIIGAVDVVAIVARSDSPWWGGPRGLVLRNPEPCVFVPSRGALGYYKWKPGDVADVPLPARWMLPRQVDGTVDVGAACPDLFEMGDA